MLAASGASGPQLLPDIFPFKSLAAEFASNSSIALLNDLSAKVRDTAQSGLQTLADGPSRFIEAFGRAQSIVSDQFASTPLAAEIQHPFPAYPDTLFTWAECNTSNPYLVVSVRDQEVIRCFAYVAIRNQRPQALIVCAVRLRWCITQSRVASLRWLP